MHPEKFQIGKAGLDTYIAHLLYDHDCVIVPQLGGFVTNYSPAKLDGAVAHPPRKDVRFNRNLTKSDGLLTGTIASFNSLTFEEADRLLGSAVGECLASLEKGGRLTFNKIGVLYFDKDRILRFSPSDEVNFLKESIGFTSFALPNPVGVPASETDPEPSFADTDDLPHLSSRPSYTRGIYRVAAATLLPFIGFGIYVGIKTDFKSPANLSLADLVPRPSDFSREAATYSPRSIEKGDAPTREESTDFNIGFPENTAVFPFSFDDNRVDEKGVWVDLNKAKASGTETESSLPLSAASEAKTPDMEVTASGETAPEVVEVHGLYHIIAGCFGERANAEDYITELRAAGYPAAVLDRHNNLYRVRLKSYTEYRTALNELRDFRNEATFSGVWMLKKRVP